jgi:ADP-ribose pyrophosphatase YjhB (NUDIX family)
MFANFALLLLINAQNEVLLLRRINTPFCNHCYSLPGGEIKRGETARETLISEAQNGLGISIVPENLEFVHIMYRKCNEPEFFACVFQANAWQGTAINLELERHDDMQWFSLDNLPEFMVPAHRHALEMIQKNILYSEHGWQK